MTGIRCIPRCYGNFVLSHIEFIFGIAISWEIGISHIPLVMVSQLSWQPE